MTLYFPREVAALIALISVFAPPLQAQFLSTIVTFPAEKDDRREVLMSVQNKGGNGVIVDSINWTIHVSEVEPGFHDQRWSGVGFFPVSLKPGQSVCVRNWLSADEGRIVDIKINKTITSQIDIQTAVSVVERGGDNSSALGKEAPSSKLDKTPRP
jgi:hypothetical protein